jgi:hypothetical protein
MRNSRIYASLFTVATLLLTAWAILANDRDDPPIMVTETITVTALATDSARPDPHARLRRYLQAYDPYAVPRTCLEIRAAADDVFDVVNQCTPDRQLLGRWRVDKLTGAVVPRPLSGP